MRLTPEALYYLLAGASIINTTSIQATQPSPGLLDYAANSVTMDTIKKASDAVRVQRTFNHDAPAAIPTDVKTPDSVNLTLTMVSGEHYSGLSRCKMAYCSIRYAPN